MKTKRVIHRKVLPGQPTDGTGTLCIHLLVPDDRGPFVQNHMLYMEEGKNEDGQRTRELVHRPTRCRLACNPKRTVRPETKNGVTTITMRTDDPRGVTCLKCKASDNYSAMMEMCSRPRTRVATSPTE